MNHNYIRKRQAWRETLKTAREGIEAITCVEENQGQIDDVEAYKLDVAVEALKELERDVSNDIARMESILLAERKAA